ncbi:MAG: hypothetical protein RLP44_04175 [Aggregatilineales bacterium]
MVKRFSAFVLVFLLALSIAPLVSAQDNTCYNLSAADCETINSASANTYTITSFNQTFSVDLNITGLEVAAMFAPEIPGSISFNVDGSGPFVILPGSEVPVELALDMVVNSSMGVDSLSNVSVPFALVGDYLYIPGTGETLGLPLSAFDDGDLPVVGELPSGAGVTNFGSLLGLDAMSVDSVNPSGTDLTGFINYVRLPDQDLMGQTMYPFQFNVDVDAILNSPDFMAMINSVSGMLGASGAEADPTVGIVLQLIPTLLAGVDSDVVITQYVGANDNFIHKLTFDFGFAIDLGVLAGATGGDSAQIPPVNIDLTFDVELSDINQVSSVNAPANARLLSEEEARAFAEQGMGMLDGLGAMGGF